MTGPAGFLRRREGSAPTSNPPGPGSPAASSERAPAGFSGETPGLRQALVAGLGRRRFWLLVGAALVAALLVVAALRGTATGGRERLALDNPAPEGGMAVGAILRSEGIDVRPSATLTDTLATLSADAGATVLLFDDRGLLEEDQLRALAAASSRLVLVTPTQRVLDAAGGNLSTEKPGSTPIHAVTAGCSAEGPAAAGSVDAGGQPAVLYRGATVCFAPDPGSGAGLYAAGGDGKTIALGSSGLLENDRLAAEGNAALALHTLGASPVLVWYRPGPGDIPADGGPADLASLRPAWLVPAGAWLIFVALLAMVWRGRRHGPLVPEPLPVPVRAAETAYGRARLYQESNALDSAADALRAGTLVRLSRMLNLGAGATDADVVAALAPHSDLSPAQLADLLIAFEPSTERELVSWAQQLQDLEKGTRNP
jgi:Domain of unknown function (DUF4350)